MKPVSRPALPALSARLGLAIALAACAAEPPAAPRPGMAASAPALAAGLLDDIRREIGDADCDDGSQCASIAIGLKACGGPETYFAWSSRRSDGARLADLVNRHREARLRENRRNRLASNCQFVPDPGAVCRPRAADGKRVCQTGQGRAD